ncbi:hypothetical protein [Haloarcula salinisoli]|uniref:Uncharacterized protein n=1 Tax=Haloarcula salinisoli TaxID=2487746 RepID=A0A8J7YIW6_9EURY|nr:hypothetical protein [Halomicroarcula salinisoli]MBX0303924.1 hypothetical protein [Halomicroarcula salinisoli]
MARHQSRRRLLGTVGAALCAALAGCSGGLAGSDGDLRIENWDRTDHSVAVTMDRGDSYDTKSWSATVEGGSTVERQGVITRSDWPYPFYLHISVDGEYRTTTRHVWEPTTEVVLRDDAVLADETDRPIDLTPAEPPPGGLSTETRTGPPTAAPTNR